MDRLTHYIQILVAERKRVEGEIARLEEIQRTERAKVSHRRPKSLRAIAVPSSHPQPARF